MNSINLLVCSLASLELDSRVEIFGVLTDNDDIHAQFAEEAADAGVILARSDAGKQP